LTLFNSKFSDPLTEGVDAFTFDWSRDNNWLVPPVSVLVHTIKHVQLCKTVGTLLVPKWKSAMFWPLLVSSISGNLNKFVAEFIPENKELVWHVLKQIAARSALKIFFFSFFFFYLKAHMQRHALLYIETILR
jgi:hypothetical protein